MLQSSRLCAAQYLCSFAGLKRFLLQPSRLIMGMAQLFANETFFSLPKKICRKFARPDKNALSFFSQFSANKKTLRDVDEQKLKKICCEKKKSYVTILRDQKFARLRPNKETLRIPKKSNSRL